MNRKCVGVVLAGLSLGVASLSAGLASGQAEGVPQPEPIAAADLPDVEEIMRLHLDGLGGEDAVRAVTSRRFVGRVRVFVGGEERPRQEGRLEVTAGAPQTMVQEIVFPGQATLRSIVQDGTAWQVTDDGDAEALSDIAATRLAASARFYQLADWREMFSDVRVRGGVSQGDRRAALLEMTHLDGRREVYSIDLDTGLLLMITGERPSPLDETQMAPFRRVYEDYREIDGVQYAYRVVEQTGPIVFEIEISRIETGVEVPEFEVPDVVTAGAAEGG
ncbi:MAG: hypothetical protein AAGJ54_10655 [Planctomycetota bacterium]